MASMLLITLFKKFYFSEFFVFSFKFICCINNNLRTIYVCCNAQAV